MRHHFLIPALLALPLAIAAPLDARSEAQAPVALASREGNMVSLRWTGLKGPVTVWQIPAADAPPGRGQKLAVAAGDSATLPVAPWPRAYFLLKDARGQTVRTAERLLPLDGGSNFRDLGGYRTLDGRETAWGSLYRSAVMSGLTPDDFQRLGKLGIQTICDFRATNERARDAVNWPEGVQPTVLATDYGLDTGALEAMFRGGPVTVEATRKAMAGFYAQMPFTFADQYARMMRELVDGRSPLAFNCSAGKDRTGLAAALLLTTLGVPFETAMADYLLSNQTYRPKPPSADDPTARMFASLPPDVTQALMGVDRSYLEASFAAIEAKGGIKRYLAEDLKLTDADIARLKQLYLVD
ncbi:tyrosine-protein phosphatase [Sandaracinobacter sp.]|uniref:tyrosine-protein phosphatase n=1 Tax=Sandaracinobacter sp. TaxID=2487581 RepID=UPI0035B42538